MSEANPYAAPEAPVATPEQLVDIDALDVSETWKRRFEAMQKAGFPDGKNRNALSDEEKKHLKYFNVLGYLFGPFYDFSKGMWKKGFLLAVIVVVSLTILDIILRAIGLASVVSALKIAGAAVFAAKVNMDYYKTEGAGG